MKRLRTIWLWLQDASKCGLFSLLWNDLDNRIAVIARVYDAHAHKLISLEKELATAQGLISSLTSEVNALRERLSEQALQPSPAPQPPRKRWASIKAGASELVARQLQGAKS